MELVRKHLGSVLFPVAVLMGVVACSGGDNDSGGDPIIPGAGGILGAGGQAAATGGMAATGGNSLVSSAVGGMSQVVGSTVAAGGQGGNGSAAGGQSSIGGTTSSGGTSAKGGSSAVGGTSAKGGSSAVGGTSAKGGSSAVGGTSSVGGTSAKGGSSAVGGTTAKGGSSAVGGTTAKGGSSAAGGTSAVGGTTAKGGSSAAGGSNGTCTIPAISNTPVGYGSKATGGGSKTPIEVASQAALVAALTAYKGGTSGLVIRYTGKVDFTSIAANPCGQYTKAEQVVDFKDMSNVTLIGAPGSAINFGLHFSRVNNVIIRNMRLGYMPGKVDAIGIESDSYNFWIDHNEIFSSMVECDGAGDLEFDGGLDIKDGSHDMTFSYNYFHDHHKVGLMGSSDTDVFDWRVTMHHNRYENVGSRLPLQRGGTTHIYNNYYNNVMVTGINVRMNGISLIESNYFENSKNPVTARDSDAIGYWDLRNNYVGTGITWSTASAPSANATTWATSKAFTASLGYSYTADPASCVKTIVTALAGAKL